MATELTRATRLDVPVPYNKNLEEFIRPSESRIVEAIRDVLR